MKNPQAMHPAVGAAQFFRRKDPVRSSELQKVGKRTQHLTRSASCNATDALDSIHGTPIVVTLKKSFSVPTLDTCSSSLDGVDPQQPSFIVETSAPINAESGAQCKVRENNPEGNRDVTKPEITT